MTKPALLSQRRLGWRRLSAAATPYLYLVPIGVLTVVFLIYPAVDTVRISFTDWTGLGAPHWAGLKSYVALKADPDFVLACVNTGFWVAGILVAQVGLGLLFAVIVNQAFFAEIFKRVLYLPAAISATATGVIWFYVFDPDVGLLNSTLRLVGLGGLAQHWLTTPKLNTFSMIGASLWQGLGPTMVLFLVGLQSIPREPIEAAQVDGASGWSLFRHITFPLLRPMTVVVVALSMIGSFKVFDLVWVMTEGGPYNSSDTLATSMYRRSFVFFHLGEGSAIAVLLSLITLGASVPYIYSMFRRIENV